jgi:hypothetical protein
VSRWRPVVIDQETPINEILTSRKDVIIERSDINESESEKEETEHQQAARLRNNI